MEMKVGVGMTNATVSRVSSMIPGLTTLRYRSQPCVGGQVVHEAEQYAQQQKHSSSVFRLRFLRQSNPNKPISSIAHRASPIVKQKNRDNKC
jgi:hypothetical protein